MTEALGAHELSGRAELRLELLIRGEGLEGFVGRGIGGSRVPALARGVPQDEELHGASP